MKGGQRSLSLNQIFKQNKMEKKCKFKYKGKCFKTKSAKSKYASWDPILKKAKRDRAPKSAIKMMRGFQKSWVGK